MSSPSFLQTILDPGSSLHPTFLLILDGAFSIILCIFVTLLWTTSGNVHFVILTVIELALWASVKWFISELRTTQLQEQDKLNRKLGEEAIRPKQS